MLNRVASVILAAGDSRRMGRPKALLPLGRKTFLQHVLDCHLTLGTDPWVVLGRQHRQIRSRLEPAAARVLVNPDPDRGPLSSLLLVLKELDGYDGALVHAVDHPLVAKSTLRALLREHSRCPACILIPRHRGKKGHPVLFPQRFFAELKQAPMNQGARWVVRRRLSSQLLVSVVDSGVVTNINLPEQVDRLRRTGHGVGQYAGTVGSTSRAQARIPPSRFRTFRKPA